MSMMKIIYMCVCVMSVNIECEENGLDYIMKIGCVDSYEIAWNIERGGCGKQKKKERRKQEW